MPDNEVQEYSLAEVLKQLAQGRFHDEATAALSGLVKEMMRVADISGGKPKGAFVLTIKMSLDRGILDLDPAVKVTAPATVRARTIMYPSPDGRLRRNDINQTALALSESRDVSTTDVRDIRTAKTT